MAKNSAYTEMLDEIIDIQKDLKAISNPLGNLASALTGEAEEEATFNPSDYREKPRANVINCPSCQMRDAGVCTRCVDVCPVHAIRINDGAIDISDACIKCDLCLAACPSEALVTTSYTAKKLYDKIVAAAVSHEQCYITCVRAVNHLPEENEIVLPCVGLMTSELWFALLADAPNISVYLPAGLCEGCQHAEGEQLFVDSIAVAEEWSGRGVGYEEDEKSLVYGKKREWERKEFVNSIARSAQGLMGPAGRVVSSAQAVANRLKKHKEQIDAITRTLSNTRGNSVDKRKRLLLQRRSLVLAALQSAPEMAERVVFDRPVCDPGLCTLCGACVKACPTRCIDIEGDSRVAVEATYCTSCGVCQRVCEEGALEMVPFDMVDLVVAKERSTATIEEQRRNKEELEKFKEQARAKLTQAADFLEKLDDEEADSSKG